MEQLSLFENERVQSVPLANRLRPDTLEEFAGQEHLLGKESIIVIGATEENFFEVDVAFIK